MAPTIGTPMSTFPSTQPLTNGPARLATSPDIPSRPCVIFDFDGTLADTTEGILACARVVLREFGMSDEEMGDLRRLIGPPFPQGYCQIYGMSLDDAWRATRRYREIYDTKGVEACPLYDGMRDLLQTLRQDGRRLAIATSKMQYQVEKMLGLQGVRDLFEVVVGQADMEHSDKPWLIGRVLELMGCGPTDAVMVGDRRYDVEGALVRGVPCVGVVHNTAPRAELETAGAVAVAEGTDELLAILRGR